MLLLICSASAISAVSDENITDSLEISQDTSSLEQVEVNDAYSVSDNNGILKENTTNQATTDASSNSTSQTKDSSSTKPKVDPTKQFNADIKNKSLGTVKLYGDIKVSKEFYLNRNLVIDGQNHVIDAQGKTNIFRTTFTLTLKNLVLKNAKGVNGPAVNSAGSKLIIDNCKFIDNLATGNYGGAVWYKNGYIEITNSLFQNNHIKSSKDRGYGGALYIYKSKSKITNTVFKSNSCTSTALKTHSKATKYHFNGGAIYYHSGSSHTLTDSSFTGNKASNHGGALFVFKDSKSLNINKCTFEKNKAAFEDGGAISFAGAKLTISNSAFKNNLAYEDGGAMDSYSLTNGKIYITIKNSLFDSNTGEKGAGAIWMGVKTVYTIDKSNFTNNKASIAGALYTEDGTAKITNCNFINNKAAKITKRVVNTKAGGKLNHCGGAIFDEYCKNLKISNCIFNGNKATYGGALHYKNGKFTFTGNTVTSCTAKYGPGLFSSKSVTISNKNKWGAKKVNTKKAIKSKIINSLVKAK